MRHQFICFFRRRIQTDRLVHLILCGERNFLISSVYGTGRGIDKMFYGKITASFQNMKKSTKKILQGEPIQVYNNGDMYRDFTYIDDIVKGVENILCNPPEVDEKGVSAKVYNIGNNKPEKLMYFIETLEKCLGKKAVMEMLPMQPGDVYQTYADVRDLICDYGFKPDTTIEEGLSRFTQWYRDYYKI